MGSYSFNKDIKLGESGEDFVIRVLEQKYKMIPLGRRKDNKFDVEMLGLKGAYTFEIKTDDYKKDTGNMAIEFECRGKQSGIKVTEANYYAYCYKKLNELWIVNTTMLRQFIDKTKPHESVGGGDAGSNTKNYLVKKHRLREFIKKHSTDPQDCIFITT